MAARGGMWLGVATGAEQALRFLRNIILARILVPEDFGLMALVIAANSAFEAFTEVGVRPCVIQSRRGLEHELLNAAWWFSAVRGAGLYLVAMLSAPLVSAAYGHPELIPLLRVALVVTILNGLVSPRIHALEKEMRYGRWVIITQGSGVLSVAVAIGTGFWLENVWALVAGLVVGAFSRTALSFVFCPFVPRLGVQKAALKEIVRFARGMLGLPVIVMIYLQLPIFAVAKFCTMEQLGMYSLAFRIAEIPRALFSRTVASVMLPALSRFKDDPTRLRYALTQSFHMALAMGIPIALFVAIFAKPVLTLAYGRSYAAAATALGILCVGTVVSLLNSNIVSAFYALGRPSLYRKYSLIRLFTMVATIVPFVHFAGISGAAAASVLSLAAMTVLEVKALRSAVGLEGRDIIAVTAQAVGRSVPLALGSVVLRLALGEGSNLALALGAVLCVATVAYGLVGFLKRILTDGARQGAAGYSPNQDIVQPEESLSVKLGRPAD